jgi:hypothetical protein
MPQVREAPGAGGASPGAISIEVDGAGPQPGDDTEVSLRGLMMHDTCIGVPRSTAPSDVTPAPGS